MFSRYTENLQLKRTWQQLWQTPAQDLAVLDGLRGLAMLMVILLHCIYGVLLTSEGQQKIDWVHGAPLWLSWIFQARGADVIFLLSAFLVTDHCLQRSGKDSWRIHHFYWRRFLRIYPLFLVALLIYLLADSSRVEYLLSNLLLMVNVFPEQKHIIPVGWSITVQAQFYFLLPLLVFLFRGREDLFKWLVLLVLLANLMRWATLYGNADIFNAEFYRFYTGENYTANYGPLMYYSLHTRFEPFALGILLAYLHQGGYLQRLPANTALKLLLLMLAIVCMVLPCVARLHHPDAWLYEDFNPHKQAVYLAMHRLVFSFGVFLLTALMLARAPLLSLFTRWMEIPAWRFLSQMIYPVYLFHMIAIFIAAWLLLSGDVDVLVNSGYSMVVKVFLLAIPISLLIALPFHFFIEKPFARFVKR